LQTERQNGLQMVVDIGCGTGIVPRSIPELVADTNIHYVGLDASEGMLTEARRNLPERVDLRVEDMHNMISIPDGAVDLGLSIYGPFSYSLEPQQLIQEFARITRENGRVLFMPYSLRLGARLVTGFSTAHTEDTRKLFYSGVTLQRLLEASGYFTDVEVIGINYLGYYHGAEAGIGETEEEIDDAPLREERQLMHRLRRSIATISPSSLDERIYQEQAMVAEYSQLAHANTYPIGTHAPGLDYIRREAELAQALGVEPAMARFMLVKATRTAKPIEEK